MSRPLPSTTWNIILFAMVVGPLFGSTIATVTSAVRHFSTGHLFSVALFGWLIGVIPAFVGGVLFAILRRWLGSGYLCAACCGMVGTLPFFFLVFGHWETVSILAYITIIVGGLSALATRYAASRYLQAL